jgi:hypothetical protein
VAEGDAVFLGYPLVARFERSSTHDVLDGTVYTQFQVLKAWKGIDTSLIWIKTSLAGRGCGYGSFDFGRRYLVIANGSLHGYTVPFCSPTKLETDSTFDIEALGRPQRAFSDSAPPR